MADPAPPVDPDVGADGHVRPQPVPLSMTSVLMVAAGGAVGTGMRFLITTLTPARTWDMVATFLVNVVGAFLLGALLESLTRWAAPSAWAGRIRLTVGTGLLGGFTTYSALATDTFLLVGGRPGWAAAYAVGTVVVGGVATACGIAAGRRLPVPKRVVSTATRGVGR